MVQRASDNLNNANGPKGNLGDWRHASRLFVSGDQRLAPKVPFLYHCYFNLGPEVANIAPDLVNKYKTEIGMLVKTADLPSYSAIIEQKKKYNRIKNVTTGIRYNDITIDFHDDNFGVTTRLLEAYYLFYFKDGSYADAPGAYSRFPNDNTFKGNERNSFKYGLDNKLTTPFFKDIQITQLARKTYTTYTLVNPTITDWSHDRVDSAGTQTLRNTITIAYEAVFYERGFVDATDQGEPKGFGATEHYDKTPSPIAPTDNLNIRNTTGVYDFITYSNKEKIEVRDQAINSVIDELDWRSLQQTYQTRNIGSVATADVGGLQGVAIPTDNSNLTVTNATALSIAAGTTPTRRQILESNPAALDAAARKAFTRQYQQNGRSGGINEINAAYNALSSTDKQTLKNRILEDAN